MRILIFNGSPRGRSGNTHAITSEFIKGAEEAGAAAEYVFLKEMRIEHCLGCFSCWIKTPGKCVINDDVGPLLEKILAADVVVAATPLYIDNVSGLMKTFMDRMIPLSDPYFDKDNRSGECRHRSRYAHLPRKKLVVVSNSGFPEQSHFQVLRLLFRRIARNMNAELVGEIYRGGGELFGVDNQLISLLLQPYRRLLRKAGEELVAEGRLSAETQAALEKPIVTDEQYIGTANNYWDDRLGKVKR